VSAFADTSFLFAFYFPRAVSEQAIAKMQTLPASPHISSLVRYEFQQAVWFEVWRRGNGLFLGLNQTFDSAQRRIAVAEGLAAEP
jgi:hypothetical protein